MFYRNSSGLANFCQSPGSFHEKPTDVPAARLLPLGKSALPRLLLGQATDTTPAEHPAEHLQLRPPAALALGGYKEDHRALQKDPEDKVGRHLRVRATVYLASVMKRRTVMLQFKHFSVLNLPVKWKN